MKIFIFAFVLLFSCNLFAEQKSEFTLPNDIEVTIIEDEFKEKDFVVKRCMDDKRNICAINGIFPFGFDGRLPKTYLKKIIIKHNDDIYELDTSGMYDAWGSRARYSTENKAGSFNGYCSEIKCAFRGVFSDAAGTFAAEWIIIEGQVTRTVLTSSNDVLNLFSKNIVPPTYE